MPQSTDGPYAVSLVICERVDRHDERQPATYVNTTSALVVRDWPPGASVAPLDRPIRYEVEARFLIGQARGRHAFELRRRDPDGSTHLLNHLDAEPTYDHDSVALTVAWFLKEAPRGLFWFDALINGQVAMSVPFLAGPGQMTDSRLS